MDKNFTIKSSRRLYPLFAVLLVIMAGCGPDPFFIPVESIEDVPSTGTIGKPLILTGRVNPGFASKTSIAWNVVNDGAIGAYTDGDILYTFAIGTVSNGTVLIEARIADGMAERKDYTQNFSIVFSKGTGSTSPSAFYSVTNLTTWLNDQPGNTAGTAYSVKLIVNALSNMSNAFPNNKYVNLDLSGNDFTSIPQNTFNGCTRLVGIIIGGNVTSIGANAFYGCSSLTSVTIGGSIAATDMGSSGLPSGLLAAYQANPGGGSGTYTTTDGSAWTKN